MLSIFSPRLLAICMSSLEKCLFSSLAQYLIQFSLVTQSCPTLCDPMNRSMPGLSCPSITNSWSPPKPMSVESVTPSNHLILCHPLVLLPSIFASMRVFSNELAVCISGQSIGAAASASVLPVGIQGWFPLGLTGWICLLSKDSQESSPTPQFKSINSSVLSFLYGPNLISIYDYWKNYSFEYTNLCWQRNVSAF